MKRTLITWLRDGIGLRSSLWEMQTTESEYLMWSRDQGVGGGGGPCEVAVTLLEHILLDLISQ